MMNARYPKDAEKHLLAVKSGLTRSQVLPASIIVDSLKYIASSAVLLMKIAFLRKHTTQITQLPTECFFFFLLHFRFSTINLCFQIILIFLNFSL